MSCHRNTSSCEWEPVEEEYTLDYDITLVNGNPMAAAAVAAPISSSGLLATTRNIFRYHYSYDVQVR